MAGRSRITGGHSLWELIEARAEADPDAPMLIDESDAELSFAGFRDRALEVAAGLAELGIGEGTPVSWQLPTRIDTVVASAALSRLGALQNPIIHLYREREVGFALRQTGARYFLVPGTWRGHDFVEMARRITEGWEAPPRILDVGQGLPTGDPSGLAPFRPLGQGAPVRWVYYTSGSTADPKGVRHTDASLIAGGLGLAKALDMSADDVGSMAFPYAHISGPDYLVTMLVLGFPAVLVEAFSAPQALEVFRRHGVTMVGGSTAFYIAFLAEQRKQPGRPILPSLRLMSGGGAPKPPELHYEVKAEIGGRGTVHGYGMTEVPMISMGSPHDTDEQLANTDGKPVEGAEVKIVRLDGTVAGPGEEGEIRVRGPMVFSGYTDPGLTREAFDEEGFFRTGDLGRLRPDGHLQITGRLKDVIVRKGENVSAKEVEDVLYTHPKVQDVAVIGLPDPERGERVCAVVQTEAGCEPLSFEEMVEHCRKAGLMVQKIPEQLELRSDMPRAATGKIVKTALRQEYSSRPWAPAGPGAGRAG
ncbi:MAG TPA: AMP-binding protein [Acidimicrobiales bacterium]|nr:AMP-binding protein [Acidimicrobiales bacterium]